MTQVSHRPETGLVPQPPDDLLLILGLGNVLCADDGLGIVAVERLREEYDIPDGVQVLDGGTLGMSLLGWLSDAREVILVDAIRDDGPPGTLVYLTGDDVAPAVRERLSVHQVGVTDLLDGLRLLGDWPEHLSLVGLVPESIDMHYGLSDAVSARVDELVSAVVREAAELGRRLQPVEKNQPAGASPKARPGGAS